MFLLVMMIEKQKSGFVIAAVTLIVFLGATFWFWRSASQQLYELASQRFEFRNGDIALAITQRLDNYEQVLISGAAFIDASDAVNREEWRNYVRTLRLEQRFPGIQGVGYADVVAREEIPEVVEAVRAEGYPEFTVWPQGERDTYTTILYLEPEDWRNKLALGYDMFSEPVRRQAMQRARDTGEVSATGIVQLVQEAGVDEQPGFLLYYPVYEGVERPTTVEERREEIEGYVYSPFRLHDLMQGILGKRSLPYRRLQIYEGSEVKPSSLIFDSEAANERADHHDPAFEATIPLDFNGARWTLRFTSLPRFEASADISYPFWLLAGGVGFSFLMSGFIWALWINQRRGWALSRTNLRLLHETHQRGQLEEELRQFFSISPDILCTLDADGSFRHINGAGERILGSTAAALQTKAFIETVHPEDRSDIKRCIQDLRTHKTARCTHEVRNMTSSGETCWIEWSLVAAESEPIFYGYGRDITGRKRMEQQLHYTAFHDKLTGVANRALFLDRLNHVLDREHRFGETYAVFILDIDNFKSVNDSYGHIVGDKLLVAFAERVQNQLRPVDTCARFGGDEFTLLIEETADEDAVRALAERILTALRPAFLIDGHEFYVGSSIGIAQGTPASVHESTEEVLSHADLALYEAKKQGKGRYVIFDKHMQSKQLGIAQMESDLRRALGRHELQVYYQPIVELAENRIAGCEALVRWDHPMLGRVGPDEFIPVAESSGLITHLGRQVMETACAALAEWRDAADVSPDFFISVNLSPREFFLPDAVKFIKGMLDKYKLEGHNLRIEVTEGVLIDHAGEATRVFSELQDLGTAIYIDDFGTGYSSLSYLRSLPVNGIKLDRSFMEKIRSTKKSREIARTVLELAKVLELQSIVEGVESDDQLQFVKMLGFGFAQGFGLHHPMPAFDMHTLMQDYRQTQGLRDSSANRLQ
jgi:diguanylate cyclase (GGDEF)-like protein/PAS domain S-box-containing protein